MRKPSRREFLAGSAAAAMGAAGRRAQGQETGMDSYFRAVEAEAGLVALWKFAGSADEARTGLRLQAVGGAPSFVAGPAGGKALSLGPQQFLTAAEAPQLDLPTTGLELFFRFSEATLPSYNPCLIAKRTSSKETRFSLHLMRSLDRLALWNGQGLTFLTPPEQSFHPETWYHVALTSGPHGLLAWIDGVRSEPEGGAMVRADATGLPFQIGASNPQGEEQFPCELAGLAIFGQPLDDAMVARHVDAVGWAARRQAEQAAVDARREAARQAREKALAERLKDPRLLAPGAPHVRRGEHLAAISFPLGGVATGQLRLNGAGELHDWQIFGKFVETRVPNSFFAVRVGDQVRALQTSAIGPFAAMDALTFRGEIPFAWLTFEGLPAKVSMEAYTPLEPLHERDAAMPCAIVTLTVENTGNAPLEAGFLASLQNPAGQAGMKNRVADGVLVCEPAEGRGHMALGCKAAEVQATANWESLQSLADSFRRGDVGGPTEAVAGQLESVAGAVSAQATVAPGESFSTTFQLAWYYPDVVHGLSDRGWTTKGYEYVNHWPNAAAVVAEAKARHDELRAKSLRFHETFYAGNLPYWLLDRINSQLGILRSSTVFWGADGFFGGWEGCNRGGGCCSGNCAHVWHYAQSHARLFPAIARQMRVQALAAEKEGAIPFRLPAGNVACDSQCGEVLEAYREHLTTADDSWLKAHWPAIQEAMEYAIRRWDPDEDGVLAGAQHNTLDVDLGGSTSWLGSMYLAALRAAAKMAELMGDGAAAKRYLAIEAKGGKTQNETLWNGEYYIQIPDPEPRRDYGNGCHIDQVLGQWWAHQLDLGWVYPAERVKTALANLLKNNFQGSFEGIRQIPRKFVDDHDAGLQMICWPHGDRTPNHILYADEVMSGFEYSAAAAMVQAGLINEGFTILLAAFDRYDGRLRTGLAGAGNGGSAWGYSGNPYGDDECGKYYARAMSIWSVLLAAQGFHHDGPAGLLAFDPVWQPEDHRTAFTASEGYGLFTQRREGGQQTNVVEVRGGQVRLSTLRLGVPGAVKAAAVTVDGKAVAVELSLADGRASLAFGEPAVLGDGQRLEVIFG